MSAHSAPTRTLPNKPSLAQLRKQAKELLKSYLARGADRLEADAEPWATPVAWATKGGHHEIVQLLRSAGAGA